MSLDNPLRRMSLQHFSGTMAGSIGEQIMLFRLLESERCQGSSENNEVNLSLHLPLKTRTVLLRGKLSELSKL